MVEILALIIFFIFCRCLILFLAKITTRKKYLYGFLIVIIILSSALPVMYIDYFSKTLIIESLVSFNMIYMIYFGAKMLKINNL